MWREHEVTIRLSFDNDLNGKNVTVTVSREHLGDIQVLVIIMEGGVKKSRR